MEELRITSVRALARKILGASAPQKKVNEKRRSLTRNRLFGGKGEPSPKTIREIEGALELPSGELLRMTRPEDAVVTLERRVANLEAGLAQLRREIDDPPNHESERQAR